MATRAGRVPLPALPLAPHTFLDYFGQWIAEEQQKVSVRTGRPLSAKTIWTHQAVRQKLAAYATYRQLPLTFEGLTKAFYDGLRNYMLSPAGRSPRTFNTYIKRLRSFLF
ncbi:MAG: phage integrase SAM-like domain-containing protein [Janthinobacterium lividum]